MKVRPGGAARLPRCPQRLTCLHHLSGPNEEVLQMGVKRLLPAAVAQAEVVAVGRAPPGGSDDAVHCGQHQRAFRTCKVSAAMERLFAGDGVGAPAVGVRDPPCRRTQREAGRLRGPYPFQRTALGRGFCGTGPQSGHAEQDSAEHRKNHPSFCFMLSCPHRRPSCFLYCMRQDNIKCRRPCGPAASGIISGSARAGGSADRCGGGGSR